jgi:hypothetical protein
MRDLIEAHIAEGSIHRTAPAIADALDTEPAHPATRVPAPDPIASISSLESAPVAPPPVGSAEPIQPIPVKTITVRPRLAQ